MRKISALVLTAGAFAMALAVPSKPASLEAIDKPGKAVPVNHLTTDQVNVDGRTDNNSLVIIDALNPQFSFEEIQINRDFREYLVQTIDRETLERSHQEN